MSESTVAAISTPLGAGGIGVIRISGEEAVCIADKCFVAVSGKKLSALGGYRAAFGKIVCGDGSVLDEAVALVFRAPKSYTGEDVVELSVHGGVEITKAALRRVLECGAKPAQNGEFTKRAFLNGKMPLSKAESVMALINARGSAAVDISRAAAGGAIDRAAGEICDLLKATAAGIAAYSDFPDEELEGATEKDFAKNIALCRVKLDNLIRNYDTGKLLREGIDCVIAGKPNVGKSTLMNMLCKSDRSIVTDIPGTTRDVIENTVLLGDITLNLSDTAGIRTTDDAVESAGVLRAKERIASGTLILAVFDCSRALDGDDRELIRSLEGRRAVIVLNKSDLPQKLCAKDFPGYTAVTVSAKSGEGAAALEKAVREACDMAHLSQADAVLINERQFACVSAARQYVCEAETALENGVTADAVGVCVDDALACLLELTGERVTTAVTDEIFKRFCVGK